MAKSFQYEKPPSRIDLTLDVATGDVKEKVELPLRLLVMSDLTGEKEDTPLSERGVVGITENNFDDVMESYNLTLECIVLDKLSGKRDMKVGLEFETLDDFEPEQVAQQVPELSRLLAARNLLKDLRNRLISMREFRERIEDIVSDEESRETLTETQQEVEKESVLDSIFSQVDVQALGEEVEFEEFKDPKVVAEKDQETMISAALRVFVDAVSERDKPVDSVDKYLFDSLISSVDEKISEQLDAIMHHEDFQYLESSWRELKFLVDRTDFHQKVEIEVLNASKGTLRESFEDSPELVQFPLHERIYTNTYDRPGADPYGAIITGYEFDNSPRDMALMRAASKVAAATHCPFIASVGPEFFGVDSMEEWKKIPDLSAHMETAEYAKWNSFRETPDSRYLGLTFPQALLRLPYGEDTTPVEDFNYEEDVNGDDHDEYLWGNSSFAFASNMVEAFIEDGWCVQIRGPQSGGKVEDLPVRVYDEGRGKEMKIPTEVPISEGLEHECSQLGFMPLSHYEGEDYAVFFSANSAQKPKEYHDISATAHSRINARLPYVFLASRIFHYLKVLQRENIGAAKDEGTIEEELNDWLSNHVTEMPNPSPEHITQHPLRKGEVTVEEMLDNPGYFKVDTMIMPHFRIEDMNIFLMLVSKMPREE